MVLSDRLRLVHSELGGHFEQRIPPVYKASQGSC